LREKLYPTHHNGRGTATTSLNGNIAGDFHIKPYRKLETFILTYLNPGFIIIPLIGVADIIQREAFRFIDIWLMNYNLFSPVLW
jgi:hypothetical protein